MGAGEQLEVLRSLASMGLQSIPKCYGGTVHFPTTFLGTPIKSSLEIMQNVPVKAGLSEKHSNKARDPCETSSTT